MADITAAVGSFTTDQTAAYVGGRIPTSLDALTVPNGSTLTHNFTADSNPIGVAYSIARRLRSAYGTGPLIRVRRSSDNTEQDIGTVVDGGTGQRVLDTATLLTFAGAGSAFIRTVYDQSGRGRNFIQTTQANQPRIVNAGVLDVDGLRAAARFIAASAQRWVYALADEPTVGCVSSQAHIFCVANLATLSAGAACFDFAGISFGANLTQWLWQANNVSTVFGGTSATGRRQITITRNAAGSSTRINQATVALAGAIGTQANVSTLGSPTATNRPWDGWISEFIVLCPGDVLDALPNSIRDQIEGSQGAFYGLGFGANLADPLDIVPARTTYAVHSLTVNNGGTWRSSRSVNNRLTFISLCANNAGGIVDYGTSSDRLTVQGRIFSGTATAFSTWAQRGTWTMAGIAKFRRARLVGAVAANATSAVVTNATGWIVGDSVRFATSSSTANTSETRAITGITPGAGTQATITFAPLTNPHHDNCLCENITSNVTLSVSSEGTNQWTGVTTCDDAEILWPRGGNIVYPAGATAKTFRSCVIDSLNSWFFTDAATTMPFLIEDSVNLRLQFSIAENRNITVRRSSSHGLSTSLGNGASTWTDVYFESSPTPQSLVTMTRPELAGSAQINSPVPFDVLGGNFGVPIDTTPASYIVGQGVLRATLQDCNFGARAIVSAQTNMLPGSEVLVVNRDQDVTQQESYTGNYTTVRDNGVRSRGLSSIRFSRVASGAYTRTIGTAALPAGGSIRVKARVRVNASYGAATRPVLTVSAPGLTSVTATHSAAADTWEELDLTLSNGTGSAKVATVSFTTQSANAGAIAYLDGVATSPWIDTAWHYGFLPSSGPALTADPNITLSEAAVAALASLATLDDLYDAATYYAVSNPGASSYTTLATAVGAALNLGSLNLIIDNSAGAAFAFSSGTITLKASALNAGSKFTSLTTTGTITIQGGAVTGTAALSASNGKSCVLALTLPAGTWGVRVADGAGSPLSCANGLTGAQGYVIPFGSTGTWTWVVHAPGYQPATGNFLPANGGVVAVSPSPAQVQTPDGDPMYQGTSSPLVQVTVATWPTPIYLDIGDGEPPLQAIYDELEAALYSCEGRAWFVAGGGSARIFNADGSTDWLFLTSKIRVRRWNAGDAGAAVPAALTSADGIPIDESNGPVRSYTTDTPQAVALAVRTELAAELAKIAALSFTVAGQVDANIQYVNDVQVTGTGEPGTEWGPA